MNESRDGKVNSLRIINICYFVQMMFHFESHCEAKDAETETMPCHPSYSAILQNIIPLLSLPHLLSFSSA